MGNGPILRTSDVGSARASVEVGAEPAFVAGCGVSGWIFADKPEICVDAHEFVLDGDLHAFEGGGAHRLFYFGKHMLKNSLIDGLLDDLKDTVFYNEVAVDEICTRGCYFGDKCIGSKHIPDHVGSTINEGAADDMESCK